MAVGRKVFAAQRSLDAFDYKNRRYLSKTLEDAMQECERAYAMDEDYGRAEHLVKVIAFLVWREAPQFAADPQKWVDSWKARREQQGLPAEGAPVDDPESVRP
jgi:hypothetical protein